MERTGSISQIAGSRDRGVRWITALALPLLLIAGTAVAGSKLKRDDRRTIAVDGQTRIVVKNGRGQTVIVGSKSADQVTIVAEMFVRARDRDEAEDLMKRLTFEVIEGEDDIVVETRHPEKKTVRRGLLSVIRGPKADMYIDYTIEIPRRFAAASWSTSGDVRISNIVGDAEVHATSGSVHLRDVGGGARVELTSGSVQAQDVGGDVRVLASSGTASIEEVAGSFVMQATSGSVSAKRIGGDTQVQLITGDLDLDGCLGNVTYQTSTGDARIFEAAGNISAVTSSGNLDIMIVPVGDKEFVLSSSSGDINVFFPPREDYGFLLDVATGTGCIEGELAIKVDEINRRRLKGVVGNASVPSRLIIETASGDVTIAERPAKRPAKPAKRVKK